MAKSNWDASYIPDQKGRVVVITGASSGLGKEAARVLARKNATIVMAVRNVKKGENAANEIYRDNPNAGILVRELNLASLISVKQFAEDFIVHHERLDILINNAGVMICPYSKTEEGFEIQIGTNHLGHFALTGHLIPLLRKTNGSRLVITSSLNHRAGNIDFSDLHWEKRKYKTMQAYADSKIANLYFTYHLARKYQNDANAPKVTVAHPGWTSTELQRHSGMAGFLNRFFAQDLEHGVLPTLRAAVDPNAESGDYFGPSRFFELHGPPTRVTSSKRSHDREAAQKLWDISENLTGVTF